MKTNPILRAPHRRELLSYQMRKRISKLKRSNVMTDETSHGIERQTTVWVAIAILIILSASYLLNYVFG